MKKQSEILSGTITKYESGQKLWTLLAVIVTLIYRNHVNRKTAPAMPPNTLGMAKHTLVSIVSEAEKLVSKLATMFYNVTGESFVTVFQMFATGGLIVALVVGIFYSRMK